MIRRTCGPGMSFRSEWFPWILALVLLVMVTSQVAAQACTRRGRTVRNTPLFDQPPTFVTSRGLVYGRQVSVVRSGAVVFVCADVTVGFTFSRELWYQIAYWTTQWVYGWASGADIMIESSQRGDGSVASLPPVAAAVDKELDHKLAASSLQAAQITSEQFPPPPPSPRGSTSPDSKLALYDVYLWSFVLLIAGMIAKILIDTLESPSRSLRGTLRTVLIPLLVSPIVFFQFIQSARIDIQDLQGYFVLLLFAFQNGFFWDTVINRSARQRKASHGR